MANRKMRDGIVFSTDPEFDYLDPLEEASETLPPGEQLLYISHDRKQRKGKVVTLVEGFTGTPEDLGELARTLKTKCGTGGSSKDGIIVLQGEWKEKVRPLLESMGYRVRLKG